MATSLPVAVLPTPHQARVGLAVRQRCPHRSGAVENQTICGQHGVVLKTTISEFKAHLSSFVAAVRGGETVLVCDRKTPVARLVPLSHAADDLVIDEAIDRLPPLARIRSIPLNREVDVVQLLRSDRDQR